MAMPAPGPEIPPTMPIEVPKPPSGPDVVPTPPGPETPPPTDPDIEPPTPEQPPPPNPAEPKPPAARGQLTAVPAWISPTSIPMPSAPAGFIAIRSWSSVPPVIAQTVPLISS